MFEFFKKTKNTTQPTHLTLDIGTEFIKTVLFRRVNGEVQVIGYDRAPQKHNAMQGAMIINLNNVIDVVDMAVGKTIAMAHEVTGEEDIPIPTSVILGIAGELVKGVVIEVNIERDDPDKVINEREVAEVIEQIKKQAFQDAVADIAKDTGVKTDQIAEIETAVNSVYIDGNKVDSPIGFRGKELTYKVYSTFAPKIHLNSIRDVAKALRLQVDGVYVQPYALAMGVQQARTERFNGIFIDIGGGTTDVAIVEHGAIVGTRMFAYGGRVFTKRLEQDLKIDYIAAEQMKIDYSDQKLDKADTAKVKKALKKDISLWVQGVEIALAEFAEVGSFPTNIYLCGGGALLPEIMEALIAHPWLQVLPFVKFPKVNFLFPNQIAQVIDKTKTVTQAMDVTPLALSRMSLDLHV